MLNNLMHFFCIAFSTPDHSLYDLFTQLPYIFISWQIVKQAIGMFLNIPYLGVLTDTFTATRSHWKQFPYQWRISLSPNIDIMLNRSIQERSNYGKRPVLSVSGSPWEAAGQDRSRPNWWSGMIIIFHSSKASLCNVTFQLKICHLKMISYHIWF